MKQRGFIILTALLIAALPLRVAAFQETHAGIAAAPHAAHGASAAAPHGEAEEADRPPLLSFDPGSAIWTIIVFLILLGVLGKFAWKPILTGLQQREAFIRDSLDNARKERLEAERLLKDYTERIEKARTEASAIVEEGRRGADAARRRIQEEAKKEADDMIARARREIAVARDDAVKQLYERTLDLASEVAGKIVRRQLTPADHRALLDEAITEMAELAEK